MPNDEARRAPLEVEILEKSLREFLDKRDADGRVIGNAKFGVYAFYDYDGEPIYVGQTTESLRTRIRRHLTNQRTDAVAMNVLDPFEVAEIEVWPFYLDAGGSEVGPTLAAAESTVFQKVLQASAYMAVLNEGEIPRTETIELPPSYRGRIVPDEVFKLRSHPDVRIARRAATIANLARVISERNVSKGLRMTLLTQARRLERLASRRLDELGIQDPRVDAADTDVT
jgi:hypothetical protein